MHQSGELFSERTTVGADEGCHWFRDQHIPRNRQTATTNGSECLTSFSCTVFQTDSEKHERYEVEMFTIVAMKFKACR